MTLRFELEPVPLTLDVDGVVRVAGTRVTLSSVVAAYENGATPEEITLRFPTVPLSAVYATISYLLHHRDEVTEYLRGQEQKAEAFRLKCEQRWDLRNLRARLLARHRSDDLERCGS